MIGVDEFLAKDGNKAKVCKDFRFKAGFNLGEKVIIVIPDMHLLEKEHTDDFYDSKRAKEKLGDNSAFEGRFIDFLDFLHKLKISLKENLEIVHVGDMYDLWQAKHNTNMIESRYTTIINSLDDLQCNYVVGNHDIELCDPKKKVGYG